MRLSTRTSPYICLPCRLRGGRPILVSGRAISVSKHLRTFCSPSRLSQRQQDAPSVSSSESLPPNYASFLPTAKSVASTEATRRKDAIGSQALTESSVPIRKTDSGGRSPRIMSIAREQSASRIKSRSPTDNTVRTFRNNFGGTKNPIAIRGSGFKPQDKSAVTELPKVQQDELRIAQRLQRRLQLTLLEVPEVKKDPSLSRSVPIERILAVLRNEGNSALEKRLLGSMGVNYARWMSEDVLEDMSKAIMHRNVAQVADPQSKDALARIGITQASPVASKAPAPSTSNLSVPTDTSSETPRPRKGSSEPVFPVGRKPTSAADQKLDPNSSASSHVDPFAASLRGAGVRTVTAQSLELESIDQGNDITLPQLSFDLSRVLFNPGVHQLRDPRSRVYNFDPYLEHLMPVSEFNYDALNPYLTSSEDTELLRQAQKGAKRYIGSSSSMTSAMSQFHYLLSGFRELNLQDLTRGFGETLRSFTMINRAPAAIFLRYRDGVYAVDADKEYDEPNVLMSLGKSMEKLLTVEKDEYETWRKSAAVQGGQPPESPPEKFHYSSQGRFLLRSQLDAWDPRLAGTGYFDLKTRAVAGIRMNLPEWEVGKGYQIQDRFGTWNSYEREYYDMARSTFLKYSLQARMGAMDGIFVAYHNIASIFGFQYIPMSELDLVLHGQSDPCLGDQEFRLTLNLMEEIFNTGTTAFPQRSLRIHFACREPGMGETRPYMQIFIEPTDETEIKAIQDTGKAQWAEFERRVLQGIDDEATTDTLNTGESEQAATSGEAQEPATTDVGQPPSAQAGPDSNAADAAFLKTIFDQTPADLKPNPPREIMGLKLTVQNKVNDRPVARPDSISAQARWTVSYNLDRMSDEQARRECGVCKTRRMGTMKQVLGRNPDDWFLRSLRKLNEDGAEWRKKQDELDAQREPVVLYQERQSAPA